MDSQSTTEHTRRLSLPPSEALRAAEEAAEQWGAEWQAAGPGARILLPMTAGVRRGYFVGGLEARPSGAGSLLVLTIEQRHYRLNWQAVLILVIGAFGALGATLWPFFPQLLGLAPLAVVLALSAWFLVAARVRSSSPEDFLDLIESLGEEPGSRGGSGGSREVAQP